VATRVTSNPYEAPNSEGNEPVPPRGVWRDRKWLVVTQGTRLPARCVRCRAETAATTRLQAIERHEVFPVLLTSTWLLVASAPFAAQYWPRAGVFLGIGGSVLSLLTTIGLVRNVTKARSIGVPDCGQHGRRSGKDALGWMAFALWPCATTFWVLHQLDGRSVDRLARMRETEIIVGVAFVALVLWLIAFMFLARKSKLRAGFGQKHFRIVGASEAYLSELPEWPGSH
jgi:hypothetical protein